MTRVVAVPEAGWRTAAVAAVAAACLPRLAMVGLYNDDGYFLSFVSLISAGREPYRDFFFPGPPTLLYGYAALERLGASAYLTSRVVTACGILLACWLLWGIARRVCSPPAAAAATAVWGVWMATSFQYDPYHHWGFVLATAMAWALHRLDTSRRPLRWAAVAGMLGALSTLTIQVMAPAVLAGLIVCLVVSHRRWHAITAMVGAGLATTLIAAVALGAAGLLSGFWQQAVLYALFGFRTRVETSWPWNPLILMDLGALTAWPGVYLGLWGRLLIWSIGFVVPLATLPLMVLRMRRGWLPANVLVLCIWTLSFFACAVVYSRLTGPLLWMSAGFACILVARSFEAALRARLAVRLLPASVAWGLVALSFEPLAAGLLTPCSGDWIGVEMKDAPICVPKAQAADFVAGRDFVQAHPRESIAFLSVSSTLYPLTRTTPPVGSMYVTPNLNSREDTERTEHELDAARVHYILYHPRLVWETVPSAQTGSDGKWLLEEYIEQKYRVIGYAGRMTVYERR
jgi:hypothetical protein